MAAYRVFVTLWETGKTMICDFEADSEAKAIEFSQRLTKQQKGYAYRLMKRRLWFLFTHVKGEVFQR